MSKIALELINRCLDTQDKNLDLGHCGLTDDDFESGTQVDIALRKCKHLNVLILSDLVFNYAEGKWISSRRGNHNYLTKGPVAINELQDLLVLECACNQGAGWQITDTFFVSQLSRLVYLNLRGNNINNSKGLKNLSSIEYLNLIDNHANDLEDLKSMQKLIQLDLTRNHISELAGLESLQSLEHISLVGNKIENLEPLEMLVSLKSLHLQGNGLSDIKSLTKITSLEHLDLNYNPIDQIDSLGNLNQLKGLSLIRARIARLEGLQKLLELKYLDVSDNRITKLKGLENLYNLRSLNVSKNYITSLRTLEKLPELEILDVSDTKITSLKSLERLKGLRHLSVADNKIIDFKNLEFLHNLEKLNLNYTEINSTTYLKNLGRLEQLFLRGNNLAAIKGLEALTELMELDLSNNKIEDITPLLPFTKRLENPLIIETQESGLNNWGKIVVIDNPLKEIPLLIAKPANENISDNYQGNNETISEIPDEQSESNFSLSIFQPGMATQTDRFNRHTSASEKAIIKTHCKIVDQLVAFLSDKYSIVQENISVERTRFAGNIADIVTREIDGNYTIYEVKTSLNGRRNIREALGQILDYISHAGDMVISKMVIVSPVKLSAGNKFFLDKLRTIIRCPIAYLHYVQLSNDGGAVFSLYE
jgi:Leucine-rich repeat (LRR) protein